MDKILEAYKDYGNPFYFQYYHGLTIRAYVDSVETGEFGNIECRLNGQLVLDLLRSYVEVIPASRPGALSLELRECLKIKQTESGEVLGWLCWPKGPDLGKSLKATLINHCQVCGNRFEPGQTVCFVPLDNNITCQICAVESNSFYEQRVYKSGN